MALSRDDTEDVRSALLAHLREIEPLKPRSPGCLYRIGLSFSALLMVLLPLLYLAMIVGVGVLLYGFGNVQQDLLRGGAWGVGFYWGTLISGVVFILFMLKPFLARRAEAVEPYVLSRADEAFLFAFVTEIARIVGAPPPREIRLNSEVNACASFRRGLASIFSPRQDLALTIGLPLLRGLPLHELAGVLAHEFGHFRQTGGMRLSFVVRGIAGWFAYVV